MMKRILSSESKEIWKIKTGSGPICRFLERRESFRYPTESAYRIWERSTLFWNIFIPSKSKKKQTPRNATWTKKYSTFERVTCSRNILRGEKKRNKNYKIFLVTNERLHVFKDKWSYLAIVHMLHVTILFLNEMQVKHNLLYIEFGPWSSLVNVEAPLIPEPNETSARQRLSGGSGSTS